MSARLVRSSLLCLALPCGCASLGGHSQPPAHAPHGQLEVAVQTQATEAKLRGDVRLDGQRLARVDRGSIAAVRVAPGRHSLELTTEVTITRTVTAPSEGAAKREPVAMSRSTHSFPCHQKVVFNATEQAEVQVRLLVEEGSCAVRCRIVNGGEGASCVNLMRDAHSRVPRG